jgi:hypothetical protein
MYVYMHAYMRMGIICIYVYTYTHTYTHTHTHTHIYIYIMCPLHHTHTHTHTHTDQTVNLSGDKLLSTPAADLIMMMDSKGLFDGKTNDMPPKQAPPPVSSPSKEQRNDRPPATVPSPPVSQLQQADPQDTDASPSELARRVVFIAENNDWNKTQVRIVCVYIYVWRCARVFMHILVCFVHCGEQ